MEKYYITESQVDRYRILSRIHSVYPDKICQNLYNSSFNDYRYKILIIKEDGSIIGVTKRYLDVNTRGLRVTKEMFLNEALGEKNYNQNRLIHKFV